MSSVILFLFFLGCKNFESLVLDDSSQLAVEEFPDKGSPAMSLDKGFIDDFSRDISRWWVSDNSKVVLYRKDDALKVVLKAGGGTNYDCWGKEFNLLDFSLSPVVKIRAKFEGNLPPTLRLSLKDINSLDANFDAPTIKLKTGDYQDYYFNFDGRWKQGWPDKKNLDSTLIKEITFFVNPDMENWTGIIFIDEIKPVKVEDIPDKAADNTNGQIDSGNTDSTNAQHIDTSNVITASVKIPEKVDPQLIDDFSNEIFDWWVGDVKIKLIKEKEIMKVELDGVGPGNERWGRGFKSIDFNKTPIIKVRMKASGEMPVMLRVDLKDGEGYVTNFNPNTIKFEPDTVFTDYYYDFTGKFQQSTPDVKTVNPSDIVELLFFVNPGGDLFKGRLFIDDISAITVDDYKNRK